MRSVAGLDSAKAAIQEDQLCAEYGSAANYSSRKHNVWSEHY